MQKRWPGNTSEKCDREGSVSYADMLAEMKSPDRTESQDSLPIWKSRYKQTVHFVDVFSFVSHYTKDICTELEGCKRLQKKLL